MSDFFANNENITFWMELSPVAFMGTIFNNCDPKLIHSGKEEVRLAIPEYLQKVISRNYYGANAPNFEDERAWIKFLGYVVVPSYENKIVLYHIQYPLYQEEWMKHEFEVEWFCQGLKNRMG